VKIKILLLDFASEKNVGDAALQIALIRLVRKYFKEAELIVSTVYGANQFPEALSQFEYSIKENVTEIIGGMLFTFFPIEEEDLTRNYFINILKRVFAFSYGIMVISVLMIGIPSRFLMKFLPPGFRHSLRHFMDADLVIWNGRNFWGPGFLSELHSLFYLFFNPVICILLRKPIACVKASVWRLKNPISRIISRVIFRQIIFMSVREENSMKNLMDLLGPYTNHIFVLPDLSFYTLRLLIRERIYSVGNKNSKLKVGLTLMDWRGFGLESRNRYVRALKTLVNYLMTELDAEILVVPQVTKASEKSDLIFLEILKGSENQSSRISFLKGEYTIKDLLNTYAKLDFLVATRMHSAIFALAVGTPVLAIAYDYGAKWGIFKMLGAEDILLNFNEIDGKSLVLKFESIWRKREALMQIIRERLCKCYENVDENIRLIKEIYRRRECKMQATSQ